MAFHNPVGSSRTFLRGAHHQYFPDSDVCEELPPFDCRPCGFQEGGRIRQVFGLEKSYPLTDPSDPLQWVAAIEAGRAFFIPETNGTVNSGEKQTAAGFGNQNERTVGRDFTATYMHP